ncbi:MAG: hypothetical protein R6W66_05200 [Pelovirga sp.]
MYLVPLSQYESVELLVHSLKAAGGEADCTMCPAYRVCMKQCLTIAGSIARMLEEGTLPELAAPGSGEPSPPDDPVPPAAGPGGEKGGLRVVK